ncbi:MAG TPA: PQQ-dependent sugar dehydrogenase, partial [Gemmatales bacterium]|nr:PQQ-dependent sugar dehydrogenase [Gemmatales bacterium]
VFFASDKAFWIRDAQDQYKQLLDDVKLTTLAGANCTISTFTVDGNGNSNLVLKNRAGQTALLKRSSGNKYTMELAFQQLPELQEVRAVTSTGETALLVQSASASQAQILCLLQKKIIGSIPFLPSTGLVYDHFGRLYGYQQGQSRVAVLSPHQSVPGFVECKDAIRSMKYDSGTNQLLVLNKDGIAVFPAGDPQNPVLETPLPFKVAPAFPQIQWAGWEAVNEQGIPVPLRPVVLTHAGDGSRRNFVCTQHGVIHVFPNKPDVQETTVFLDLQKQVNYHDNKNEEGLLGLAFHPEYKKNGEFFVYYTRKPGLLSVVSRFRVKADDPNRADPASEEVLLTLKQPMWNHNGGTICFGKDGYLYIALGDGGGANDMYQNSRKMDTFHSKILRIDVNRKSEGKPYGIPADNPFVGKTGVLPEIYCYGVRNAWRLAFDRQTGQGWFGEVGQNLYEEINLLEKGADYGWNLRESYHPFGSAAVAANSKMVEPIWEYHHDLGKSITGGHVYRGKAYPELAGKYFYADYVSARIWALQYDFEKKRVVANQEIGNRALPIMSFGEDEDGELYLLTFSANGQGIDRIVRTRD